MQIKSKDTKR